MRTIKEPDDLSDQLAELEAITLSHPHLARRTEAAAGRIRADQARMRHAARTISEALRTDPDMIGVHDLRIPFGREAATLPHILFNRRTRRLVHLHSQHSDIPLVWDDAGAWNAEYADRTFPIPSPVSAAKTAETLLIRWMGWRGLRTAQAVSGAVLLASGRMAATHRLETATVPLDRIDAWVAEETARDRQSRRGLRTAATEEEAAAFLRIFAAAHAPLRPDWPAILGIAPEEPRQRIQTMTEDQIELPGLDDPGPTRIWRRIVETDAGLVEISRYEDGTRTLRSDDPDTRVALADACAAEPSSWSGVTRAWYLDDQACRRIIRALGGRRSHAPSRSGMQMELR